MSFVRQRFLTTQMEEWAIVSVLLFYFAIMNKTKFCSNTVEEITLIYVHL